MNNSGNVEGKTSENDYVRTPRWLANLILPAFISIAGTYGVYTAQSGIRDVRTTHLETEMEKKANAAEVVQGWTYFQKQLDRIEGNQGVADKKLDSNLVKQQVNGEMLEYNIRLMKLNSDKLDRNAVNSAVNSRKLDAAAKEIETLK